MTPRVCADALWRDFLAHLAGCETCQAQQTVILGVPHAPLHTSCPEGWALLNTWGTAAKRERAESAEMETLDCAE